MVVRPPPVAHASCAKDCNTLDFASDPLPVTGELNDLRARQHRNPFYGGVVAAFADGEPLATESRMIRAGRDTWRLGSFGKVSSCCSGRQWER